MSKDFFKKYQKDLLYFANTEAGRYLLGLPDGAKGAYIFKITPEAIHWTYGQDIDGKWLCQTYIQCLGTNTYAQILLPIFTKMEIANEFRPIIGLDEKYKAFLHFSGLERYNFPQIYLAEADITPAGGTSNAEAWMHSNGGSWANWNPARSATPSLDNPTTESMYHMQYTPTDLWILHRRFWKIDYTSLPTSAIISQVDWRHKSRYDTNNSTGIETSVIALGTQADTITTSHWASYSTEYGRKPTGTISDNYSSVFRLDTLNDTGKNAITPGVSIIKYAWLKSHDFDNSPFAGNNGAITYGPNASNPANRPMMRVTYTLPKGAFLYNML